MACAIPESVELQSGLKITSGNEASVRVSSAEVQRSVDVKSGISALTRTSSVLVAKNQHPQVIPYFKNFLASIIREVPEVKSVLMQEDRNLLIIRIVVNEYNFDVNEKIYDKEECIIDVFRDHDFDFHITTQEQLNDPGLAEVLPH